MLRSPRTVLRDSGWERAKALAPLCGKETLKSSQASAGPMVFCGAFVLTSHRPLWITTLTLREWQLLCRIVSGGLGPELACILDG